MSTEKWEYDNFTISLLVYFLRFSEVISIKCLELLGERDYVNAKHHYDYSVINPS